MNRSDRTRALAAFLLGISAACPWCHADRPISDAAGEAELAGPDDRQQQIVADGRAAMPIVIAADATPAEITAAEELRAHVLQMTGVDLSIRRCNDVREGACISVGVSKATPADLAATARELADQEIMIVPGDHGLAVIGGGAAGTLFATYEFLHRLGVRWYTPSVTEVPRLRDIPLPAEPYRFRPPIVARRIRANNEADRAWTARNRLTSFRGLWEAVGPEYGLNHREGPDTHTFWRMVPRHVLDSHPEWLAEVNGKREQASGHFFGLDLSNAAVRRSLVDRTLEYARANPDVRTLWISQNDGPIYDQSAASRALYDRYGGVPSAAVMLLANELSEALERSGLGGYRVKTLAYDWSLEPPSGLALRDNIEIMVCGTQPGSLAVLERWRKLTDHIDVYQYGQSQNYWFPSPTLYRDLEEMREAHRRGANRFYYQLGWADARGSEMMDIRAWVYARATWDPSREPRELVREFIAGFYGPAAEAVQQAVDWTEPGGPEVSRPVVQENGLVPEYVDVSIARRVNELLAPVYEALPEGDHRRRLETFWLPYLWADFWAGCRDLGGYDGATGTWQVAMSEPELRRAMAGRIQQFMARNGVNAIREHQKINPGQLAIGLFGTPWPARMLVSGSVEAVVVPGIGGQLFQFRDRNIDFNPLKYRYGGQALQYPAFSATQDDFNGRVVRYDLASGSESEVTLVASAGPLHLQKRMDIEDGWLRTTYTVRSSEAVSLSAVPQVMFSLADGDFGLHPTLWTEMADGTWDSRPLGTETDFWWIGGEFPAANTTGRYVLQRQDRAEGVELVTPPTGGFTRIGYWYDKNRTYPDDTYGMLRLFFTLRDRPLQGGETLELGYRMRIVSDVATLVSSAAGREQPSRTDGDAR
ncbi:MAG: DUF4838 domain-containing protein [Planctomycetia bacterium]